MKIKINKKILGLIVVSSSIASAFAMSDMMSADSMNGSMAMEVKSNLTVGSRGGEVISLQTFLVDKGFLNMPIGSSKGYFGNLTKIALMSYQRNNSINATGYFGPMTRAKFNTSMSMKDKGVMNESAGVMVGGAAMLPIRDIVDNAVLANNVTTVVAAVKAAGLVDTLKSAGPFTVFAPNNAAFAALPSGTVDTLLKSENKSKLTDILTYHVVSGRYKSKDLTDGLTLKTVEGKNLTFTRVSGVLMINGNVSIETADIISSNGVTHVINSVLMPN